MSEPLCVHDMDPAWCAICNGTEARRKAKESEPAKITWFTAKFDSECAECPNDIEASDRVAYVDDEVCCEKCALKAEAEKDAANEFKPWK